MIRRMAVSPPDLAAVPGAGKKGRAMPHLHRGIHLLFHSVKNGTQNCVGRSIHTIPAWGAGETATIRDSRYEYYVTADGYGGMIANKKYPLVRGKKK